MRVHSCRQYILLHDHAITDTHCIHRSVRIAYPTFHIGKKYPVKKNGPWLFQFGSFLNFNMHMNLHWLQRTLHVLLENHAHMPSPVRNREKEKKEMTKAMIVSVKYPVSVRVFSARIYVNL